LGTSGTPVSADERLFLDLYVSLRRFACVVKSPEMDADDLVQEAVVRTLALGPLSDHQNPGAYLRRTIINLAANERRGFGRRRRALLRVTDSVERAASYPSDLDDLLRLTPAERAAVYLSVVERWSHREVAAVLDCTEAAGRARVSRALRKLRLHLHEEVRDA
jgi:RNA polymerase sigma factor (sigma-70 family)